MLKKEYLVAELLDLELDFLPTAESNLSSLAKKENWQFKLVKSDTAGRPKKSYLFSSFPPKLQMAIIAKVYQPSKTLEIERSGEDLDAIIKHHAKAKQNPIYQKRLKKALAKEFVLTEITTLKNLMGEGKNAINTFVTLYNGGKIDHQILETNIYEILPNLAERTVRSWQKEYKQGGITAFFSQEQTKKGIIDNSPELQSWIIEKLTKHPWAPTNVLYRALILEKNISLGHTTFKTWVRKYKQENKLLLNAINYFGGHSPTFIIEPSNKKYSKYRVEFHPISLAISELDYGRNYGWEDSDNSGILKFATKNIKKIINVTGQINPFTTYLNKALETTFENSVLPENAIKSLDLMASRGISFIMYDEEGNDVIGEAPWENSKNKGLSYTEVIIKTLNTKSSMFSNGLETKTIKFTMQLEILQFKRSDNVNYLTDSNQDILKELLGVKL